MKNREEQNNSQKMNLLQMSKTYKDNKDEFKDLYFKQDE